MHARDPYGSPAPEPDPAWQQTTTGLRVAFQGERGAFGEEAIHLLWRGEADPVPAASFEDVMHAAETSQVDYGILPIESTLVGGLDVAYDLLSLFDGLYIVSEVIIPVNLCLLALPGATIKGLRTLASHPVMLGQCSHFLDRHRHITPIRAWDSAGAARDVREMEDPTRGAAGTRRAAERFGLTVLLEHLEDRPDSQMRFLAVARNPTRVDTPSLSTISSPVSAPSPAWLTRRICGCSTRSGTCPSPANSISIAETSRPWRVAVTAPSGAPADPPWITSADWSTVASHARWRRLKPSRKSGHWSRGTSRVGMTNPPAS